ncbi:hypothetical protein SAMN04489712_1272 [Thermomonospora echinospora]|uniref:Lipoprotein n=1 Tax=Thermomonospora echinospora TaxID=1992 RepID=A0A1H6E0I5_9ACTN|nr:hypothetical protein [Thermomonospora echinospora]SEG90663.1 hypothetical protein SAMN04489712_1272 [Thermomonospora echinospora]
MVRRRTRLAGLAAVLMAGCALLPSSTARPGGPVSVDEETAQQLTAAARTMLERRTEALVQQSRTRSLPAEVLGVRISPRLVREQQEALRRLETRNRAPVAGGPPFTAARTRLTVAAAVRDGDRIILDATEYTEMEYATPAGERAMTQQVRRRFEFSAEGGRFVLVDEHVVDPDASPINDPDGPPPAPPAPPEPSSPPQTPPSPSPETSPPAPSPAVSPSVHVDPAVPEPGQAGRVTNLSR